MTKAEIIDAVATAAGISKRAAGDAVNAVFDTISQSLKRKESVTLTGFGTFQTKARAAREGVNPQNPTQKIQIPARNVPTFKAGKALKELVRK